MARGRDGLAVLAATLVAVALALGAQLTNLLDRVEDEAIGVRFELRGEKPPSKVAVVAIDDATFSRLQEQWPFPRSLHGRAIDRLREAGARVVVYDVQFTEPTTRREDDALARAVERMPGTVLATTETDGKGATNVLGGDDNLAAIGAQAAAANLVTEAGGVVKRFPREVGGLRSIAAVATEEMTGRVLENRDFEAGGAWIDFAGPRGTVPSVSFGDLLAGRADTSLLRDRVVVVGATAPTLRDVHTTPLSAKGLMSGPEIQANAISTALAGLPLRRAPGWIAVLAIIAMGLAPALARRHIRGALVAVVAAVAYVVATQAAFEAGHLLPMTYPLLALALGTVGSIGTAFLTERRERSRVEERNDLLEQRVRERTEDLRATQMEIVQRLGQAAESRDEDTGEHIERISRLSHLLALAAGVDEAEAELIGHASAMHDVGKIGIPDRVLLKPGRLNPDEWALMRTHTTIGGAILGGSSSRLLQVAESIALTHHERWDGSGYPAGLTGEEIPLAARICTICDVYDALLSSRTYKPRWSLDQALIEIERERGRHFDPGLVDVFVRMVPTLDDDLRRGGELPLPGVLTLAAPDQAPAPVAPARPAQAG